MSYTVDKIKVAAYNWTELPNMTPEERILWEELGDCYEYFRSHPEEKAACEECANDHIKYFTIRRLVEKK